MADITRADKLATMGLRVILKIYADHPAITRVIARDTLPTIETQAYDVMTDTGGSPQLITDEDLALGGILLGRLVQESIITGQITSTSVSGASIPPIIRRALTQQAEVNSNIADMLGEEIAAVDNGEERPPGTFTRYAQDIGFQP